MKERKGFGEPIVDDPNEFEKFATKGIVDRDPLEDRHSNAESSFRPPDAIGLDLPWRLCDWRGTG